MPYFTAYVHTHARAYVRTYAHTNEINAIYIYFIIIYYRNNVQLYIKAKKGNNEQRKRKESKKEKQHKDKKIEMPKTKTKNRKRAKACITKARPRRAHQITVLSAYLSRWYNMPRRQVKSAQKSRFVLLCAYHRQKVEQYKCDTSVPCLYCLF